MECMLKDRLEALDIILDQEQINQFDEYYEILVEWNKVMNLTGITEYQEVVEKHFLDSLSIVKVMDMDQAERVIDIGTGAGFPGIPLKIAFPKLDIVLLDSLNKRIRFLDHVIEELGLEGIRTIHGRAEDYARDGKYRERFDLCVSRAVANLSSLSEYCLPYVKVGGRFVSYKSGDIEEEVNDASKAIALLGGKKERIEKFQLPDTDIQRSFVVIGKTKNTQKRYPRKAGMPTKEPLK
ncbi:16S rRNA (guanine(527)-N(7))-methyltransferase GidB [Dorea sp. 5-2]|nr:16S rRNA (guanine(527)-N(7))-methyltransferase GidB [Dorea sp. 5-2]